MNSKSVSASFCVLLSLSGSLSCKKPDIPGQRNLKGFIIGADNMVESNSSTIDHNGSSLAEIRSVGSIASLEPGRGAHFCTGFLIAPAQAGGNPRVVTNYHCFTANSENAGPFASWACQQTKIYLGLKTDDFNSLYVAGCKSGTLKGHENADIAVYELAVPVPGDIKFLELDDSTTFPITARVIHHPVAQASMVSPPGELQKVPGSVISRDACVISSLSPERQVRPDSKFLFDVSHTCDIVEGSSGAPVINSANGKVAGVNWGGIQWASGTPAVENRAVSSSWLRAFLNGTLTEYEAQFNQKIAENNSAASQSSTQKSTSKPGRGNSVGGCSMMVSKP